MKDKLNMQRIDINSDSVIFTIGNEAEKLISTNYFDTEFGKKGIFYLSFNAGVGRLLIPDSFAKEFLNEIKTARHVVLTMGKFFDGVKKRDMGELMFEDNSSAPFSVHIQADMIDRKIEKGKHKTKIRFYTRDGEKEKPMKLFIRTVVSLPCLQPW